MRITENRMLELAAGGVSRSREQVVEASRKLQTGVDVERPSQDPGRWADGMRQKARLEMTGSRQSTVGRAVEKLDATDDALGRIMNALTRVRELATSMANGTNDGEARAAAAVEVEGLFGDMLAGANSRGLDGEYLLAGTAGDTEPFDASGNHLGNDLERSTESSEGQRHVGNLPGTVLTATAGVDVFATVTTLRTALLANDPDAVRNTLVDLSDAIDQVAGARTSAGGRSAALEVTSSALDEFEVQLNDSIENAVMADPLEAATVLAKFSNQLESSRIVSERIAALTQMSR